MVERSETFDLAFGHRIPPGPEFAAWHDLGHDVTALDFSEAILAVARKKHDGRLRLRFLLADTENTLEPDERYDATVCRHLVWALTQPQPTLEE